MNDDKIIYEPAVTDHWRNLFAKKSMLLGCQNLHPDEELVLFINRVEKDATVKGKNGREDPVSLIHFDNCAVPMCLNVGKSKIIESLYGGYTSDWVGKPIQIYAGKVKEFGGKGMIPGLCIREFKPDVGEDVGAYQESIENAADMDELKSAYMAVPKHLQGRLSMIKDKRKAELS